MVLHTINFAAAAAAPFASYRNRRPRRQRASHYVAPMTQAHSYLRIPHTHTLAPPLTSPTTFDVLSCPHPKSPGDPCYGRLVTLLYP